MIALRVAHRRTAQCTTLADHPWVAGLPAW